MLKIVNIITAVNKSVVWLVGILITAISILLTIDVILRYFFRSPTSWAFDLSTWGTAIIALSLGGYALVAGQHIRVDLYFERLTPRQQSLVDMITAVLLLIMASAMVWLGSDYVVHYYKIGATATGGFAMPLWIKWLIIPIGGILLGLQGLVKFVNDLHIVVTGKELYKIQDDAT